MNRNAYLWVDFDYHMLNSSNPYIAWTNQEIFRMFCKYHTVQTGETSFLVIGIREWNGKPDYKSKKAILESIAIDWQRDVGNFNYSYADFIGWSDFFEELGKKYGLLTDFRKNGII